MLKLYQFAPSWNLLNASPFCMKLETYLRLCKIPYETVIIQNPNQGPKGKLPFIEDNGQKIGDSSLIIDYLKKTYGDTLDKNLTMEQIALATAIQRLLEDHLYWINTYYRWIDPTGWAIVKTDYFGHMPPIIRTLVPEIIRKNIEKSLYHHGIGRHTPEEIASFGKADVNVVSQLMGQQKFMLCEQPTSIDACVYAFLANTYKQPIDSPVKQELQTLPNLVTYIERMDNLIQRAS